MDPFKPFSILFYFEAPSTIAPLRKQSSMDDFLALNSIQSIWSHPEPQSVPIVAILTNQRP